MRMEDFSIDVPWAIERNAMDVVMNTLFRKTEASVIRSGLTDLVASRSDAVELTVIRGAAVIPLSGVISKRLTFWSDLMGGASLEEFIRTVSAAAGDDRVSGIVVYVDSPGGVVTMVPEAAAALRRAASSKPVAAYSDGVIMSAAYWIGSAAEKLIISPVAAVGSIGVLTVHTDFSKMDERMGVKYTYITAGKYKAEANDAEPLSDPARRRIEVRLRETYDVFVSDVARHRSAPVQTVLESMAEGRVFIGRQALEAGLVDQIGSLDDAIDFVTAVSGGITITSAKEANMPEAITTIEQMQAAFPDLCRQMAETAAAGVDVNAARIAATHEEMDRVLALARIHFGDEAADKFGAIVKSGVTLEQYNSMAAALKPAQGTGTQDDAAQAAMLAAIRSASAPDVGAGGDPSAPVDFMAAARAIRDRDKCTMAQAISAAARQFPELHKAYISAANKAS